ncbi:TIM21-domain-containing protein [Phlyctochytrium arcticum]|nr:TIM21-domain-containing protein [Phlyctochytrium arcticum]
MLPSLRLPLLRPRSRLSFCPNRSMSIRRSSPSYPARTASTTNIPPPASDHPKSEPEAELPKKKFKYEYREPWINPQITERVYEWFQNLGYGSIVIIGLGVIGTAFYSISQELADQSGAWKVYEAALERIMDNEEVQRWVGIPMVGVTDGGARGKGLSHHSTPDPITGKKILALRFFLKGSKSVGTVHVEMMEDPTSPNGWKYHLVLVDVPNHTPGLAGVASSSRTKQIVIVDERAPVSPVEGERKGWFGLGSRTGARRM